jgi:urease gamma subunit
MVEELVIALSFGGVQRNLIATPLFRRRRGVQSPGDAAQLNAPTPVIDAPQCVHRWCVHCVRRGVVQRVHRRGVQLNAPTAVIDVPQGVHRWCVHCVRRGVVQRVHRRGVQLNAPTAVIDVPQGVHRWCVHCVRRGVVQRVHRRGVQLNAPTAVIDVPQRVHRRGVQCLRRRGVQSQRDAAQLNAPTLDCPCSRRSFHDCLDLRPRLGRPQTARSAATWRNPCAAAGFATQTAALAGQAYSAACCSGCNPRAAPRTGTG